MSEQKMRDIIAGACISHMGGEHLEYCVDNALAEIEALAQQPAAAVELTDAELHEAFSAGFDGVNMSTGIRAVIAASEAKKAGGSA